MMDPPEGARDALHHHAMHDTLARVGRDGRAARHCHTMYPHLHLHLSTWYWTMLELVLAVIVQ